MYDVLVFLFWCFVGGVIGITMGTIFNKMEKRSRRRSGILTVENFVPEIQAIIDSIAKAHNDSVSAQIDNNNLFMDRLNELHIRVESLEGENACQEVTGKSLTSLVVEYEPTQHSTSPRS